MGNIAGGGPVGKRESVGRLPDRERGASAHVGLLCVQKNPEQRPAVSERDAHQRHGVAAGRRSPGRPSWDSGAAAAAAPVSPNGVSMRP
uniref:Uncharacterized protein n=1 Tax=Oryza brachyantha TaxID=4533 RepID=J3MLP9_ORYBR